MEAEFEGPEGKERLDIIIQKICTRAHWMTWQRIIALQRQNQRPLNIASIAPTRGVSIRKIEMDVQQLRELGLLQRHYDFSNLYTLAHEYYLWEQSAEYIEPKSENAEDIRQEPELEKRLRRFDNYRRVLDCKKPGRKRAEEVIPLVSIPIRKIL